MTITQPLALTATYMTKQFANVGQTQTVNVFGDLAHPPTSGVTAAAKAVTTAGKVSTAPNAVVASEGVLAQAKTGATKRTGTYIRGATPSAGTVSGKVACCTPNQDFLRDFYDAASTYGGTVSGGLIP